MQIALLLLALLFIGWDVFLGFRRGLYPALIRLGCVCLCFLLAYLLAAPLSGLLMKIPIPFLKGQTLQAAYDGYIVGQAGLSEALALSETIEMLVLRFPRALLAEINFVILFMVFRILSIPLYRFLLRRLFGGASKATAEEAAIQVDSPEQCKKTSRPGLLRGTAMAVGFLQAIVCLAVVLVPIFGVVEFGERFHETFVNSDESVLVDMSGEMNSRIVEPINKSFVVKTYSAVGLRKVCVGTFHGLSRTKLALANGVQRVDYFEYLESVFPAVSALLKLSDVDSKNMTDEDYENLALVLRTAEQHEDLVPAVKKSVENVVAEFVEDSYRESADVIVTGFSHRIVTEKKNVTAGELKQEVEAVKKTMKVIKCASKEESKSAFDEVPVGELVDDIILTTALYDTLVEASVVPEQREILSRDFASSEDEKADMKADIEAYRAESMTTRSPAEIVRILEITDALAVILGIEITPVS